MRNHRIVNINSPFDSGVFMLSPDTDWATILEYTAITGQQLPVWAFKECQARQLFADPTRPEDVTMADCYEIIDMAYRETV
jgi:hypothetical protein